MAEEDEVEEAPKENTEEIITDTEMRIRILFSKRDRSKLRLNIYYN